jgi:YNFM family putative membrane transporter
VSSIVSALSHTTWASLRHRLSENALAGMGGLLMGAAYLILIPRWPWPVFALSMLMLGLGFVGLHSTLQLRGTEISPAARGKAFSLFAFNLFTGIAVGTAVLGGSWMPGATISCSRSRAWA